MIDQHELVRYARHVKTYHELVRDGLITMGDGTTLEFPQPDHPRVVEFCAQPRPQGDMLDRAYLMYEAGQVVAEAKATKRSPEIIERATEFGISVTDMPMPEVRKHLKFFLAMKNDGSRQ
jgi:hypothetical protein